MAGFNIQQALQRKQPGSVSPTDTSSAAPKKKSAFDIALAVGGYNINAARKLVKGAGTLGKAVLQGTARGISTIGRDPSEMVDPTQTPGGKVFGAKRFFGTDQPFSLESETAPISKFVSEKLGTSEGTTQKVLVPLMGALNALDLTTGGGKKEAIIQGIKTVDNIIGARQLFKDAGVTDDVIDTLKLDRRAVATKTDAEAEALIKEATVRPAPVPERAPVPTQEKNPTVTSVRATDDVLLTEAKKYKTAEEFADTVSDSRIEPFVTALRTAEKNLRRAQRQGIDEIDDVTEAQQRALADFHAAADDFVKNKEEYNRLLAYAKQTSTEVDLGAKELTPKYGDKSQLTDIWKKANSTQEKQTVVTPATQERGFVSSVKEKVPGAVKVAGQYVPRSTDELSIKAANLVRSNPAEAERLALAGSDENAVALASELIKKYSDDATKAVDDLARNNAYDKVAEIANTIAPKLTEQGRAIQAASILGRMTPEGQLRFAAREIQKFNETNPLKKIPELTGEQAKVITDEMRAIGQMPDGIEKAMRFQKLQNTINDLVPTPLWKKITTIWKAGLLTGVKTTGLNLFSNLGHSVSEVAKDAPAAVVDSVASLFTGKRTKTFTLRKAFDGIKEGSVKGKRYFSTGFDERNIGSKLDYNRVNFGKGVVGKAFQAYTDTVFRLLGATDQPFYYAAMSRSLMDQALASGKNLGLKGKELVEHAYKIVENPTDEMIRYGVSDATTAVFQNRTNLGDMAGTVQKIPGVGQILLPFARTPSSVAMQIIGYSPVGAIKTIIENVGRGKFDQRMFSQGMGRSIVGTAFLALGYKLAEKNMVSLGFPTGNEPEQELQKAEGRKANAILINGKWRSPMVLGPLGNIILAGAYFGDAVKKTGSPTEAAAVASAGVWKSFLEQTFLTGINNATKALTDPETYATSYLKNLTASFVPTLVSDVARATDPLERKVQPGFNLDAAQSRIPGLRRGLEPDVDVLGRERESAGNPLEILADPTRPSPATPGVVTDELRRIMDAGHNVSLTKVGDKAGYDALSPEQNTELWKKTGEILNSKLTSLFNSPQYRKMDDEQRADAIKGFIKKSQDYGRAATVVEVTEGLSGEALKTKLSELKAAGLLTRDVLNAYQSIR